MSVGSVGSVGYIGYIGYIGYVGYVGYSNRMLQRGPPPLPPMLMRADANIAMLGRSSG